MKLASLALFIMCGCAAAEPWTLVQSQHFELYTSGNPDTGRDTIVFFEQVHGLFAAWNAKEPVDAPRVRIINFGSEQEYRKYQPNPLVVAYFITGVAGDFIVATNLTRNTYPVALHEYVHLVVKRSGLRLPSAMNEGLAEFYATLKVTPAGIEIGTPPVARLLTLRHSKLFPLEVLLAVDTKSPIYHNIFSADIFYAESWALTHMLLLSPAYRDKSRSYAREVQAGPDPVRALERITGKSAAGILADLEKYSHRDRFVNATLDGKWDLDVPLPVRRPATEREWGTALAGLLDSMGRHAEAQQRYAALDSPGSQSRN
jgi:hypothetical protein